MSAPLQGTIYIILNVLQKFREKFLNFDFDIIQGPARSHAFPYSLGKISVFLYEHI
jgi:hypothetical protein